ncbi:hypothetical protein ACX0G7_10400 [Flavitalea antarctica]
MIVLYIFGKISAVLLVGTVGTLAIAAIVTLIIYLVNLRKKSASMKMQADGGNIRPNRK